jgi:thiol:disulfide interchange protein DsbA
MLFSRGASARRQAGDGGLTAAAVVESSAPAAVVWAGLHMSKGTEVIMKRPLIALFCAVALLAAGLAPAAPALVAGKHFSVLPQAQRTSAGPGKVEVLEVFSYGCPACNHFRPAMKKLKLALPANAQLAYLPASWNTAENWPLFQRAFLTAQSLGVAEKAHDAVFEAIWTTGELGIIDNNTQRIKSRLPSIDDMAKFYQRVTGVKAGDFVNASKSFSVDLKMRQADAQILAMQVPSTPTLVVAGKYRINNEAFKTEDEIIEAVKYLVAKESPAAAPAVAPPPAKKP